VADEALLGHWAGRRLSLCIDYGGRFVTRTTRKEMIKLVPNSLARRRGWPLGAHPQWACDDGCLFLPGGRASGYCKREAMLAIARVFQGENSAIVVLRAILEARLLQTFYLDKPSGVAHCFRFTITLSLSV